MEIKTAKTPSESETIREAKRSEQLALGLLIGSVLIPVVWFAVPEQVKAKMAPFIAIGGGAVATAFQRGLIKIKNGRMAVGDLPEVVKNYALLPAGEARRLENLKPFVEGLQSFEELPQVRSLIDNAVKEAIRPKDVPIQPKDVPTPRPDFSHLQPYQVAERQAAGPIDFFRGGIRPREKSLADLAAMAQEVQ